MKPLKQIAAGVLGILMWPFIIIGGLLLAETALFLPLAVGVCILGVWLKHLIDKHNSKKSLI